MDKRAIHVYRGAQLIIAQDAVGFKGVAWSPSGQGALARESASSEEEVLNALKLALDAPNLREALDEFVATQRQDLLKMHGEFLRVQGIDASALTSDEIADLAKRFRHTKICWRCGHSIDNAIAHKCRGCGWLICTSCGACGHTHPDYRRDYASTPRGAMGQEHIERFDRIDDARALANRSPGAILQRSVDGQGRTVTVPPK